MPLCQMNDNHENSAESQHNFHFLTHFNSKTLQSDVAFCLEMPEQRVKTVNFYVCKKAPKLIGYHSNVYSNTAKIISVS